MIIGVLKEVKKEENRVSLIPSGVEILAGRGHKVLVEKNAGRRSGFQDKAYEKAGAEIAGSAGEVFERAEMVLHVKEPMPGEYGLIRKGQIVFTYFHLAASQELTRAMVDSGAVCIAYETIQKTDGSLPLLVPMSEVAGRMSIQEGAKYLEMAGGGEGVLLGGVPGVEPCTVLVIGGGVVGTEAARMACGLGAKVYLLDTSLERLRHLSEVMPRNCFLVVSNPSTVRKLIREADVVVGAVLIPGAKAPKLVTRDMLKTMKRGAVMVDVAIDQGGCFETSRATTHSDPIYKLEGVVHYCVSNMPGAVARTSTLALTNATIPYVAEIADKGWKEAVLTNDEIRYGLNVVHGKVTYRGVSEAFGMEFVPVDKAI